MDKNLEPVSSPKKSLIIRPFAQAGFAVALVTLLGWAVPANAALNVVNGDFSDLAGLTPVDSQWYHGTSAGWTSNVDRYYSVNIAGTYGNSAPPVANLDPGVLKQNVGTTASLPVVTLTFDMGTFNSTAYVTARITDGTTTYATATFDAGTGRTLKAIVPVGSPVTIEFEKAGGGSPWVDNVSVAEGSDANLINNGSFTNGLTGWLPTNWGSPGASFGTNTNGPTDTSAASGNYAYAGGGAFNLLQQRIVGTTNGGKYRLTFKAGSQSGQGSAFALLSLYDGQAGNYNPASFDYRPSDASFGTYTVDFTARAATDLWLRNDGVTGGFASYTGVSVEPIADVVYALNYSNSAAGYSQITTALSGSGKVAVHTAASGAGLTLRASNSYTGGTEVNKGRLYVDGAGSLGDPAGAVTISDAILDLRNTNIRTGPITIKANGFILSGATNGFLVNNGSAFEFQGGSIELPLSGTGGMNVTGGGRITSSNSYTGATTISATPGWYGTGTFFLNNANGLGDASASLTISGGTVSLVNNTLTRSGNLTISGGTIHTGTISKSGSNYDIQGGNVNAVLAGTAGLTKSGGGVANLNTNNTYSGGTIINGGTLGVAAAGGLGDAAGAVTVNTGAGLYISSGLTINRTGNVTVDGGSLTTDNNNMATISVSGGNFIANNAAVLALKLAGTGGLTVGGTGDTYLWADSSYTGATVISSGKLVLGGAGAISANSAVQIASGASFDLTGNFAPNNINRAFSGLTGAGVLIGSGGTLTINKSSGTTDTFTGEIRGAQGLVKSGAGTLALGGASSYTGTTMVNEGRLVVAHADALGGTNGGTVVVSGAQLRINTLADTVFASEPLIISGEGVPSGGALRNATNNNTWKGRITLAANSTIGAAGGTTLTLEAASGASLNLAAYNLVVDGAGTVRVNGAIAGSGQISKTGSGQLVVSNSVLAATILSNSVSIHFATPPADGVYAVLSGPLDAASLATANVTGLAAGKTATVANSPNLVIQVTELPSGPTFDTAYSGKAMTDVAPNGLTYLMNYAFGGSSSQAATLPSQDVNDPTKLTLVAFVRTNNTSGTLSVVGEKGDSLSNFDTANPILGQVASDQSNAPAGTQKQIFSVPATGDRLFLRLKATLQP